MSELVHRLSRLAEVARVLTSERDLDSLLDQILVAVDQVFDLFDNLGATEEQLDFPVVYASALNGIAGMDHEKTITGGDLLKGYYSFVEDFWRNGVSAQQRRRARYGNGWMPINGRGSMLDELDVLAEECAKNDRDVSEIELSLYAAPPDADEAKRHEDAGVARFVFGLPPMGADVLLPILDSYAEVIAAAV